MKRMVLTGIVAVICAACGGSTPATSDSPGPADETGAPAADAPPPAPVVREISVPDGTALRLDLVTPLDSDTSRVEDVVRATLRQAVTVNDETVLPAGSELTGNVTDVEGSGRVKGRARIAYRFTSLRLGNERHAIQTAVIAHEAEATKGEDAKKIGIGAGIGAAVGAIVAAARRGEGCSNRRRRRHRRGARDQGERSAARHGRECLDPPHGSADSPGPVVRNAGVGRPGRDRRVSARPPRSCDRLADGSHRGFGTLFRSERRGEIQCRHRRASRRAAGTVERRRQARPRPRSQVLGPRASDGPAGA